MTLVAVSEEQKKAKARGGSRWQLLMRLSAKDVCVGVEGSDFVLKISEDILDDPLVNFAGHFVAEDSVKSVTVLHLG